MGWRCFILFIFFIVAAVFSSQAAVLVFNNDTVLVASKLTEKNGEIIVAVPGGEAAYTRDQIVWYSADDAVSSFWAAAQAAEKQGRSEIGIRLAKEVLIKEPANASEARQMIYRLEQKKLGLPETPAPAQPEKTPAAAATTAKAEGGFEAADSAKPSPVAGAVKAVLDKLKSGQGAQTETKADEDVSAPNWPVERSALNAEDLRVNVIIAGIFGLIILFSVWKIIV